MNADVGGNCEMTVPGEVVTTENGITIVGTKNLAGELASTASMLFSNNMATFLSTLVDENSLRINMDDAILVGAPEGDDFYVCLLYTSPSPRDQRGSRMPSSA